MRFYCQDPFSAVSRVIDTARRLDLPFANLTYDRLEDGRFILSVALIDNGDQRAQLFKARLALICDLEPEVCHD
ncbi:hypothetical protein [Arenibacterium halophilum]|uniref:ACT domain-containing protein n=1 Tax=Arenibacterium halophilum TaxID=2583821 RepID=A0ABY2X060_9RHOB|nr:hypothetical protein [Arenibacterium halophilum]TMV08271.1 hypothetical protein FGK64_20085 [Arenibacterium halophilum]